MLLKSNNFIFTAIILVSVSYVKSLDTGYKIIEPGYIENVKLLKCSYLFNAIFNIKLHKINLENPDMITKLVVNKIFDYGPVLKKKLSTLFFVKGIELGSLWLLNLYILDLGFFGYHRTLERGGDLYYNILKTLNFVIEKLSEDVKDCPKGSQFYTREMKILESKNIDVSKIAALQILQIQKIQDIEKLMDNNNNRNELTFNTKRMDLFTKYNLFLKRFKNSVKIQEMLDRYNIQVSWNTSENPLEYLYDATKFFEWSSNNFKHHKRYFNAVVSFMKIILFRLTWKHLLYLKYQRLPNIPSLIEDWLTVLNNFSFLLHLQNDVMIIRVTETFNDYKEEYLKKNFIYKFDEPTVITFHRDRMDCAIENLKPLLENLCVDIGCNAICEMDLNGNESIPFNAHKFQPPPVHDVSSFDTIFYNSVMYGNDYINSIKYFWSREGLEVVCAFIDYIDEITKFKPFDDIDLSDDFKHLRNN